MQCFYLLKSGIGGDMFLRYFDPKLMFGVKTPGEERID